MKATFNLPDELYREVKSRSALEGRPVRDVVINLFRQWLGHIPDQPHEETDWAQFKAPLGHLRAQKVTDHSMDAIRSSIENGFSETILSPLRARHFHPHASSRRRA